MEIAMKWYETPVAELFDDASTVYEERIPSSTYDEKRIQLERVAKVVKRNMYDLLTMSAVVYRVLFSDEKLRE